MYESFFGLGRRPFAAAADADCYYPATAIEASRQTLFRCIDRGEGAALLIGPAGSGKSLLLQVLAEQFRGRFGVALLGNGRFNSRRELLQAILYELRLPYRDQQEGELRLALIDHLSGARRPDSPAPDEREGMLLLIDEAHTLHFKLLEEVRLITNLVRGGQPKVRLVLAGSSALEERFTSPKLDAFNQRVSARCYLQPFDRTETREYVKAQIEWAGGQRDTLFTAEALDNVYQATQGVPRLINQVCDHALLLACAAGTASLDKSSIEEAWADLQQLPTPWNREANAPDRTETHANDVIEFGVLDDESQTSDETQTSDLPLVSEGPASQLDANVDRADTLGIDGEDIEIEVSECATISVADDSSFAEPWPIVDENPVVRFQPAAASLSTDFDSRDPLRRLSEVEQQLAGIDTELPPGSDSFGYGDAAEMTFDRSHNPFNEMFAEEELVIDPFAMTAADALANRPLVHSEEGRNLARLLKPLPELTIPKLSLATPPDLIGEDDAFDACGTGIDISIEEQAMPAIVWWSTDEAAPTRFSAAEQTAGQDRGPADTVKAASQRDVDAPFNLEPDLIVIEDEPASVHQATVVRRGQYRQLFSNLRRG